MDRVLGYEPSGQGFESLQLHQNLRSGMCHFFFISLSIRLATYVTYTTNVVIRIRLLVIPLREGLACYRLFWLYQKVFQHYIFCRISKWIFGMHCLYWLLNIQI